MALLAASPESGDWTMRKSEEAGKVQFSLMQSSKGHNSQHSSKLAAERHFKGWTPRRRHDTTCTSR